ncbi:helix-turn-helix domain-containing protein [Dietzia cinnamea]|uniref:helix-turn-helix domain-containing protein n=1 Tax=Dietzia cinnamea TaxID=321318 RepID=UPI0009EB29C3|nr:helix-turn-helix domain-containing protein [Dietzia cinnamea]
MTAAELAAELGTSERHAKRLWAEPREAVEARAAARRGRAAELRAGGATYREIAEALDCSTGTVGRLLHEHRERAGIPQPGRGRRNTTVPMVKKTA